MNEIKVIVSGHGGFASGIQAALSLLIKVPENWQFIDFTTGMSDQEFVQALGVAPFEETVFFTDLAGGTLYNVAATLAADAAQLQVVAGCNLASLMETMFQTFGNAHQLANALISTSHASIKRFDPNAPVSRNADSDDGI
ncbi:PTS sugar transporter [Pediococcus acidilactici]|uniref:PTS sugar transporter subunit IIA domain-containing protein n=1 Tax=Pediococcus acidilactici TaxID=1254 RepID=UPI003A9304D2